MASFRKSVRRLFRSMGYDLRVFDPQASPTLALLRSFQRFGIDCVFDIGANVGQFASELRLAGFRGDIVSFEPLSSAHAVLSQAARGDPRWKVHPRAAVGDRDGEISIHIAGNSESSSVLSMMESHRAAAQHSAYVGSEAAPIVRLDSVAPAYLAGNHGPFLKVDTQGFEWQVLDGARATLAEARGVLCELSLVPLYEGQRLWGDMMQRLAAEGFTLWSIQRGFTDPRDGRTLQVDATFFRL